MTNMREYENEMQKIVYEEFGDELYKKDAEIELKNRELKSKAKLIKQYREKFKELNELKDLKPEAKSIVSELLLL